MSFAWLMVVAAATGAIALSYEIVWYRVWSFASLGARAEAMTLNDAPHQSL